MALQADVPPTGVRPVLTERYLCSLEWVIDARVWWRDGHLAAQIVVHDEYAYTPRAYQRACCEDLGLHQTPRRVVLMQAKEA